MKTKLQRIAHLLLVIVATFSIFTGGLLLNAHHVYALDFPSPSSIDSSIESNLAGAISNLELKLGSTGERVNQLQTLLNRNGANPPVTVDGTFGSSTQDAVMSYQKKHGLTSDGVVDQRTDASLNEVLPPSPNPSVTPFSAFPNSPFPFHKKN
jgi:hypothetical protein